MRYVEEFNRLGIDHGNGVGIFMIDFSAYFPYANQNSLKLEASLSTEPRSSGNVVDMMAVSVVNHRYPNHGYMCMSSKHGRKICKNGCVLDMEYKLMNEFCYLNVGYGFSDTMVRISVPISINVTEDTPCVGAEVRLMLEEPNEPGLIITVFEKTSDNGWRGFTYSITENQNLIDMYGDRFTLLTPKGTLEETKETGWVIYSETVRTIPCTVENLFA